MNRLSAWTRRHFVTLMLLFVAGGFGFILAELLLERHWEGVQLVAPVSAGLGFVLALVALRGWGAAPVAVFFVLLSVTGLFGTLAHFRERTGGGPPEGVAQVSAQLVSNVPATAEPVAEPEDDRAGPPGGFGGPPWLAPLSLSGLALLGVAATLANVKRERRDLDPALPKTA